MIRSIIRTVPILLFSILCACTEAPPPAPDTRAADEKAIKDAETQWLADIKAKDLDKDVSHYADDAAFMMSNMPIQTGKDTIRKVHQEMMSDPNLGFDFTSAKVEVSKTGDIGYSQGSYAYTMTDPKTKKPVTEKGKYVTVFKKQADGSWKAIEDMLNSDGPVTPAGK